MVAVRAPKTAWCWWCRRAVRQDDDDAVRVLIDFDSQWMCGECYAKSDPPMPLDYTEERDDHEAEFDIEGQPEFNGAFR